VDVRVVAATNRNLKAAVAARQFRDDLYFRLSVFPITIPALRERAADIRTLARYFIDKYSRDMNKKVMTLSPAAEEQMQQYPWPGNVRELQNCIERAVILTEGDTIQPHHLHLSFRDAPLPGSPSPADESAVWSTVDFSGSLADVTRRVVADVEKLKIQQVMNEAAGNRGRAAELLRISYKALLGKLRDYSIEG
jgi:DNA-binding NtrC family response regulator